MSGVQQAQHYFRLRTTVSCRRGAEGIQTQTGGPVMIRVELDPDEAAVEFFGGRKGGTGPRKWIKHGVASLAEGLDQRFEDADRFLRRVQAVAGILPVEHVRRWTVGKSGKALGQQIGGFMLIPQVAGLRRIRFAKDDVTGDAKPCFAPRGNQLSSTSR